MALKSSMKILLADQNNNNRQVVRKMLSDLGFKNVQESADGENAWKKIIDSASSDPVKLIIADMGLPKITGLDLLKKVRDTELLKKTPFLMITGEADQQHVVLAVRAGVNNVIVRPFSGNTLVEKIAKIFGQGK